MSGGPFVAGIDLGGTNVRVAAVSFDGQVLVSQEEAIQAARGPQVGLEKIARLIEAVSARAGGCLAGIGIGSTGPVDRETGAIQNPYTLPTWEDVSVVTPLRERFGVPVALENDADAAALGEHWVGIGHHVDRLAAVTVGTGIGTAFILHGQIYRGMGGLHGEAGHQVLDPAGPPCYCGARGCWEMLAAGPAIGTYAQEQARLQPTALLDLAGGKIEAIDAALVSQAARTGDPVARAVVDRTARYLGLGLVNLILFYLPDVIVLSGGVMRAWDLFEPGVRAELDRHSVMIPARQTRLDVSMLGRQAGVLGAARSVLNLIESGV